MSGYRPKSRARIARAVLSPLTSHVLVTRLPDPAVLAQILANLPPGERAKVMDEVHEIRESAEAYREMQGLRTMAALAAAPEPPAWVSTAVAARELDRTVNMVRKYREAGRLTGKRDGKFWHISRESLDALKLAQTMPKAA
ncbi:helix-turn-helix domain-containing protein [Paeniglutamicibacter antarcticus]|uniref:Helix-turn-helix domain-containing protein n=1 Tax=Paeniglutamicibacter antarcticus TaxID=494023 RepID=A0ABP9TPA8_9MICC